MRQIRLLTTVFFAFVVFTLSAQTVGAQTLPAKVRSYLTTNYKGWVQTSVATGCTSQFKKAIVVGDFDGNGSSDYAVKFIAGKKGYIMGFIARGAEYTPHKIGSGSAADLKRSGMALKAKGSRVDLGVPGEKEKMHKLKNDSLTVGTCESEVIIYAFRNGAFGPLN